MTEARGCLLSWPQRIVFLALSPLILLAAMAGGLWHTITGGADTSPDELAKMLRDVAEEGENSGHLDELDSVNLRDKQLEAIRREALTISLPLKPEGREKLIALAAQAEALIISAEG